MGNVTCFVCGEQVPELANADVVCPRCQTVLSSGVALPPPAQRPITPPPVARPVVVTSAGPRLVAVRPTSPGRAGRKATAKQKVIAWTVIAVVCVLLVVVTMLGVRACADGPGTPFKAGSTGSESAAVPITAARTPAHIHPDNTHPPPPVPEIPQPGDDPPPTGTTPPAMPETTRVSAEPQLEAKPPPSTVPPTPTPASPQPRTDATPALPPTPPDPSSARIVRVRVAAVPGQCMVSIDGSPMREAPFFVELTVGVHEFSFVWPNPRGMLVLTKTVDSDDYVVGARSQIR